MSVAAAVCLFLILVWIYRHVHGLMDALRRPKREEN